MNLKWVEEIQPVLEEQEFISGPVDNPVKMYKSVGIDHPKISIHQNNDRMKIHITGYQYRGEGNYERTETIIENVRED